MPKSWIASAPDTDCRGSPWSIAWAAVPEPATLTSHPHRRPWLLGEADLLPLQPCVPDGGDDDESGQPRERPGHRRSRINAQKYLASSGSASSSRTIIKTDRGEEGGRRW